MAISDEECLCNLAIDCGAEYFKTSQTKGYCNFRVEKKNQFVIFYPPFRFWEVGISECNGQFERE